MELFWILIVKLFWILETFETLEPFWILISNPFHTLKITHKKRLLTHFMRPVFVIPLENMQNQSWRKKTIEIKCVSVLQICYYFTDKNSCNHSQKILRQLSNFSFKPTVIFLQHSFDLIKRKKRYFAKKIVI